MKTKVRKKKRLLNDESWSVSGTLMGLYSGILSFLWAVSGHMKPELKDRLLFSCFSLLSLFYIFEYSSYFHFNAGQDSKTALFILVMVFIMAVLSMRGPKPDVKMNGLLAFPYFIFALVILYASLMHPLRDGYVLFSLTLLILPVLFISWAGRDDRERLFDWVSVSFAVVTSLFFISCIVFAPLSTRALTKGRYLGLTSNANRLGILTVSTVTCALYLISRNRHVILSGIAVVMSVPVLWYSGSRTAFLADIVVLFVFITSMSRKKDSLNDSSAKPFRAVFSAVLIGIILTFCLSFTDTSASFIEVRTASKGNAGTSVSYSSPWTRLRDFDTFTEFGAGRVEIMNQVISKLNWKGYDPEITHLYFEGKEMYGAHNNILEFAFLCGIPGLVASFLFEAASFVLFLKLIIKRKREEETMFVLLAVPAFLVVSSLDIHAVITAGSLVLFYYLSYGISMFEKKSS